MFTGLIQALGVLTQISETPEGKTLVIACPALIDDIRVDDSVATNGVCLTAVSVDESHFTAHAIHTTLQKTAIGSLIVGDKVNLELAMRANARLGGHLVQGHVNAIARITAIETHGDNWQIHLAYPAELRKYMVSEGSITLDGISLTIAALTDQQLMVSIIPHTLSHTNLRDKAVGSPLNLELDIMAKYIENFLRYDPELAKAWAQLNPNP